MGIFDRMGRVITSNFNALLDKAEDPKKSIELTLSEMKEQIKAARREVVSSVAAEKQLVGRIGELDRQVQKWQGRAELAIQHGDDQLAREALIQKRRLTHERDRTEAMRAEQRGAALEMKAELERMEQKLQELSAKRGTLAARAGQAKAGGGVEALGARGSGPSAFEEFRRMEDQIEGVEAAVSAQREIAEVLEGRGPTGLSREEVEARFRQLEGGGAPGPGSEGMSEVEEELMSLKERVRIKS